MRLTREIHGMMQAHYQTHKRALSGVDEIGDLGTLSEQIHTGGSLSLHAMLDKLYAMATGLGVAFAQGITCYQEPKRLAINLGTMLLVGGAMTKVLNTSSRDARVVRYTHEQTEFNNASTTVLNDIQSQQARISIDVSKTPLPALREKVVTLVRQKNLQSKMGLELPPMAAGFLGPAMPDSVGSIVTSLLMARIVMEPYLFTPMRARLIEEGERARGSVYKMLDTIAKSDYKIPTVKDLGWKNAILEMGITSREKALAVMTGPLQIRSLSTGSEKRQVSLAHEIILQPGKVSFIKSDSGDGKSELWKLLTLDHGEVVNIEVVKGVDLRTLPRSVLFEVCPVFEASSFGAKKTMAQELEPFVLDRSTNLYKTAIQTFQFKEEEVYGFSPYGDFQMTYPNAAESDMLTHLVSLELQSRYGIKMMKAVQEKLLHGFFEEKKMLLEKWIKNPSGKGKKEPVEIVASSNLLTAAALATINPLIPKIDSLEEAESYLVRRPDSISWSLGEAQRFALWKVFAKERAFIMLDEPTGNLPDVAPVIKFITSQLQQYSNTVVLASSNEGRFQQALPQYLIDKIITPTHESTKNHVIWQAHPYER